MPKKRHRAILHVLSFTFLNHSTFEAVEAMSRPDRPDSQSAPRYVAEGSL